MQIEIEDVITEEQKQELAKVIAERDSVLKQIEDLKLQSRQRDERDAIEKLVKDSGEWLMKSAEDAAQKLASKQLKLDDNGKLIVIDPEGHMLAGKYGEMTPEEFLANFRQSHSYLTKSGDGHAAKPAEDTQASDEHLRKLFSSKADGKYAQAFFKNSPAKYRQLRALAAVKGIR